MSRSKWALALLGCCVLLSSTPYLFAVASIASQQSGAPCPVPLSVDYRLPYDAYQQQYAVREQQQAVNCFAWQTFIALNWPVDPRNRGYPDMRFSAADFGQPDSETRTVWQTFKLVEDVFRADAAPPPPFPAEDDTDSLCPSAARRSDGSSLLVLQRLSKFGDVFTDVTQAFGPILVDQDAHLVRYEARMNQDAYAYIQDPSRRLYDADTQAAWALSNGILLPASNPVEGLDGAIEIKAAWRQLPKDEPATANLYKTTLAVLYDPTAQTCSESVTMGLVGLHIVRKTQNMQQMMWATFEHVDNVPEPRQPSPSRPYSFHDPLCGTAALCTPNVTPPPTPLPPAVPTFVPVQVTREQTIPDDIHALNEYARQVLVSQNPESVWQYYQLVNVSWPYASKPDLPAKGATVPLDLTYFQFNSSGSQPVSNVALETYVQGSDCSACHNAAPIARSQVTGCERKLAAGFSYMFRNARPSPSSTPCPAAPPEPLGFGP